jgi:hypothetical protein
VQPLPETKDYQKHSAEVKIDALDPEVTLCLLLPVRSFNDSTDKLILQTFDISGISYISSGADHFVLSRESGQPIQNIKSEI